MVKSHEGLKKQRKPRLVSSRKIKDSRLRPYCGLLRVNPSKSKAKLKPRSSDTVNNQGNMMIVAFDGEQEDVSQTTGSIPADLTKSGSNFGKFQCKPKMTKNPSAIINGFIGFRCYYCKYAESIPQSKLSRTISEAWRQGANQDFWCNKAAKYNCFRPNTSFIKWLKSSNHLVPDFEQVINIMSVHTGKVFSQAICDNDLGSPLSDNGSFSDLSFIGSNGDIGILDLTETLFGDTDTKNAMAENQRFLDDFNSLFAGIANMPSWSDPGASFESTDGSQLSCTPYLTCDMNFLNF